MEAPLLNGSASDGDSPPVKRFSDAWVVFLTESRKLWAIAAPIALNILCLYGLNSTTQIFVGHLGNLQLSAVAISLSVVSNFSFGFLLGMGSALETLCGQAFGAGQVYMLGIYLQRSWIILTVSCIIMLPLYIFAAPILKLIGQESTIADLAGTFSIEIIPQLFALAFNFPSQKFLQAQSKVMVMAWIGCAALLLHVLLLWLFIYVFGWGLAGAAAAYNISSWTVPVGQVIYITRWCRDGWTGLSWLAFRDIWAFVRLSLASAVMLCLEIWYMMVLVVLTGHLGNAEIAVGSISICMNINGWEGMVFIGINAAIRLSTWLAGWTDMDSAALVGLTIFMSVLLGTPLILAEDVHPIAIQGLKFGVWIGSRPSMKLISEFYLTLGMLFCAIPCLGYLLGFLSLTWGNYLMLMKSRPSVSIRVSNELGAGRPRATKHAVMVVVLTSLFIGLFFMALILIFRDRFAVIFTSSKELQKAVAHLAYLLGVTMVLNSIQPVISGVAVGGGWQALVAYINLACYYIFGLPFGFLLGYKFNLGVEGIWAGMLCGTLLQTLILLGIIWKTNWKKEADQASERVRLWGGQEDEPSKIQI